MTKLFDDDNWAERLNYYYDHYHVRSIQLGHQLDNRFTGVAPHHFIFKLFQFIDNINNGDTNLGFDLDSEGKNKKGLTSEGKELIRAMMDKKMIIDIAHMSERAVLDLYDISAEYDYYPFILSHGHLRSIMLDKKQKQEKQHRMK